MTLQEAIKELDEKGWPSVADDLRDGITSSLVLQRLRDIGEEDSDAFEIVASIEEEMQAGVPHAAQTYKLIGLSED